MVVALPVWIALCTDFPFRQHPFHKSARSTSLVIKSAVVAAVPILSCRLSPPPPTVGESDEADRLHLVVAAAPALSCLAIAFFISHVCLLADGRAPCSAARHRLHALIAAVTLGEPGPSPTNDTTRTAGAIARTCRRDQVERLNAVAALIEALRCAVPRTNWLLALFAYSRVAAVHLRAPATALENPRRS